MELITTLIDFILHIDTHLTVIVQNYGLWTYLILFLIIFCETGLVVTPFLPGDSLVFAIGAIGAIGDLNIGTLFVLLSLAAVLGNTVNYEIGRIVGPKIFSKNDVRFLNKEYLDKTHKFYEKHGGKTIIITRFMPIIRTFAPFVAGVGKMPYMYFALFNLIGGVSWISLFLFGGYFFGNLPSVKHNFSIVIFAIIIISLLPAVIEFIRNKKARE